MAGNGREKVKDSKQMEDGREKVKGGWQMADGREKETAEAHARPALEFRSGAR